MLLNPWTLPACSSSHLLTIYAKEYIAVLNSLTEVYLMYRVNANFLIVQMPFLAEMVESDPEKKKNV